MTGGTAGLKKLKLTKKYMAHQHSYSTTSQHDSNNVQTRPRPRISKKGLFSKDLPTMMYGFGDPEPQRDAINLMEEMVVDHISDVLISAHRRSTNRGKLKVEDIKAVLEDSTTAVQNAIRVGSSSTNANHEESKDFIKYAPYPMARRKVSLAEKQLSRIEELLFMQDDLTRARGRGDDLKALGNEDYIDDQPLDLPQTDKGKQ